VAVAVKRHAAARREERRLREDARVAAPQ